MAYKTSSRSNGKACGRGHISAQKKCHVGQRLKSSKDFSPFSKSKASKPPKGDLTPEEMFRGILILSAAGFALYNVNKSNEYNQRRQQEYEEFADQQAKNRAFWDTQFDQFQNISDNLDEKTRAAKEAYNKAKEWAEAKGNGWEDVDWEEFFRGWHGQTGKSQYQTSTGKNWWDVLGVKPDSTPDEIKRAYQDKSPSKELTEAYKKAKARDKRKDSFNNDSREFRSMSGMFGEYVQEFNKVVRGDRLTTDRATGKRCGKGFISASKRCRAGEGLKNPEQIGEKIKGGNPSNSATETEAKSFATQKQGGDDKPTQEADQKAADQKRALDLLRTADTILTLAAVGFYLYDAHETHQKNQRRKSEYEEFEQESQKWSDEEFAQKAKDWAKKTGNGWEQTDWDKYAEATVKNRKYQYYQKSREAYQENEKQKANSQYQTSTGKNWWDVLGVKPDATPDEIKKAYRKQAFDKHPDRNKAKDAEDAIKEVNEAYERAKDRDKRKDSINFELINLNRAYKQAQEFHRNIDQDYWNVYLDHELPIVRSDRKSAPESGGNEPVKKKSYGVSDGVNLRTKETLLKLRRAIVAVFGEISAILKAELGKDGYIRGLFRKDEQVYEFDISPKDEISYIEVEATGKRSDSILYGYYLLSGMMRYHRNDAQQGKKCSKCNKCGLGCVEKGKRCRTKLSGQSKDLVGSVRSELSQPEVDSLKKSNAAPGNSGGISDVAMKAAIAAAIAIGVPTVAYLATRERYRAGFSESARMAEEKARSIDVGTIKARQHTIIFGSGGMAYADESPDVISGDRIVTAAKMAFSQDKGKDFKLVPVSNASANVPADQKRGTTKAELDADVIGIHYRNIVEQGRNPAAVEMAAHVIAYADKYPDRQLVMMGHSMGGMIIHEAQEILRISRPEIEDRLQSFAFGTQWGGLTNKFGESHTIGSPKDPFTNGSMGLPVRDLKTFEGVEGHTQGNYFSNPEVKDFVSKQIYKNIKRKQKNDSAEYYQDKTEGKNCVKGKRCGLGCVEKGRRCKTKLPAAIAQEMNSLRSEITSIQGGLTSPSEQQKNSASSSGRNSGLPPGTMKAAIAGAALIGVPILGYLAFRAKYREGFKESAEQAKQESARFEKLVPDELTGGLGGRNGQPAKHITLVVGGFADDEGRSGAKWAQDLEGGDDMFADHYLLGVSNKDFEEPEYLRGSNKQVEQMRFMLRNAVENGRNPSSVRMAAVAYAFHQKHPDVPINLLGYSAGGMITHEAAEILNVMGIKTSVANFGSPHWGLTEKVGRSVTFASIQDAAIDSVPVRDRVNVNVVKDHFSYLRSKALRERLKDFLDGNDIESDAGSREELAPEQRQRIERRQRAAERAERMAQKRRASG